MTNEPRHLNRAPIVEAMIAFDFVTSSGGLDELKDSFFKQIEPEYPTQVLIQRAEVKFDANGSTGNTSTVGKRSLSADGKNVCAISENTFLCSRLSPYENWETFRSEFRRLWEVFTSFGDVQVEKVAVRYINKISIREGSEIFDSIYTYPKLAAGLPDTMTGLFVRLQISIPEPPGVLVVTEAGLPEEKPGFAEIALDHDLQFPIGGRAVDVWELLERARELKNRYFFASVSDELLKEYA